MIGIPSCLFTANSGSPTQFEVSYMKWFPFPGQNFWKDGRTGGWIPLDDNSSDCLNAAVRKVDPHYLALMVFGPTTSPKQYWQRSATTTSWSRLRTLSFARCSLQFPDRGTAKVVGAVWLLSEPHDESEAVDPRAAHSFPDTAPNFIYSYGITWSTSDILLSVSAQIMSFELFDAGMLGKLDPATYSDPYYWKYSSLVNANSIELALMRSQNKPRIACMASSDYTSGFEFVFGQLTNTFMPRVLCWIGQNRVNSNHVSCPNLGLIFIGGVVEYTQSVQESRTSRQNEASSSSNSPASDKTTSAASARSSGPNRAVDFTTLQALSSSASDKVLS